MAKELITLRIPAIHCDGCVRTARATVEARGAEFISGDAEAKKVEIRFDPDRLTREDITGALEAVGFAADPLS